MVSGDELHRLVMDHYASVHNLVRGSDRVSFPSIAVDEYRAIRMMRNVSYNKGIAYDGVTDEAFRIGKD